MDCRQYQDALNATALGAESPEFRLHLKVCEDCRKELSHRRQFLGALDQRLQMQFESAPAPDFNARLRRRIAVEQNARPAITHWLPVFAGAAAIAVLLVTIYARHKPAAPREESTLETPAARPDAAAVNPGEAEQTPSPARKSDAPQRPLLHPVMAAGPSLAPVKVRIDRHEFYATVRFAQAIADGHIDAGPLLSAAQAEDVSAPARQLKMPVLEIAPLQAPSDEPSSDERGGNGAANH